MKKIAISLAIIFCIIASIPVFASNVAENTTRTTSTSNTISSLQGETTVTNLVQMKENEKKTLEDYQKSYGSETYGLTAYILNKIQILSIPFCFIGIAVSAIYQYVLGIRKLDTRDKGFAIMISIVTLFIIAQVLPLIFAIVVKGWRG